MKETRNISRTFAMVPGLVVGVLWVVAALGVLWVASRGAAHDESGWVLGFGLVGTLLLAAGGAALIGTWWHNTRVNRRH